ncbi:MAG TPA: protease pro-enzyme activation domain-containing protein [Solirubrobacteraceae bacterium]|jgi:subtilase family serine protease|nr:protease pro-enzyme activation domain-containing protein [Solirubrobacteraceae bacterium]
MSRSSLTARVAALAGVCAVGAPVAVARASADTETTRMLAGSAAAVTSDPLAVEAVRDSPNQTVQGWMAVRQQAAQRFADAVSTPGSPTYQRFLSPTAYTQRFGPSAAQVDAVKSHLTRAGFSQVRASVNDDFISATAPLATIDRVFSVRLRRYLIGPRGTHLTIESSDRDPTVPVSIRDDVLSITGVNTTQRLRG